MDVAIPTSLEEALDLLAVDGARRPVAGATDLLVSWHDQPKDDLQLLDLEPLRGELSPLKLDADELWLGALTTYWDLIRSPKVCAAFPLLAESARQIGSVQIQTRGTWAGNIENASPAADGVLALMACDARVVLRSRLGCEEVPLDEYYINYRKTIRRPDQLIVAVRVPRRTREHEWFHKVGTRRAQAITKVGVAAVKDAAGWRVVANSVAPTVRRCRALERTLESGSIPQSPEEIRQLLAGDISPIDDIRSTARYRATVLSRLLHFWLRERRIS